MNTKNKNPGWIPSPGDTEGRHQWWDGENWVGDAQHFPPEIPPQVLPFENSLATSWNRVGAAIIDWALVSWITTIVITLILEPAENNPLSLFLPTQDKSDTRWITSSIILTTATTLYFFMSTLLFSATPGKYMVGLKIVRTSKERRLGLVTTFKRTLNKILIGFTTIAISWSAYATAVKFPHEITAEEFSYPLQIASVLTTTGIFLLGASSLAMLFGNEQRTVMDKFADTYVIKVQ